MAVPPIFHVYDLVVQVASFLEDQRDLLRLGRTCQALTPTLDIYWERRVVDLDTLILLFPKDLLLKSTCKTYVRPDSMEFIRRPVRKDWDGIIAGARRIQKLRCRRRFGGYEIIDYDIYKALAFHCPVPDLFPALKHLVMDVLSYEELFILVNCLKPQVTRLEIDLRSVSPLIRKMEKKSTKFAGRLWTLLRGSKSKYVSQEELSEAGNPMTLLQNVSAKAPFLTHMKLNWQIVDTPYFDALHEIIGRATHLRELNLGYTLVTPRLLKAIALLSSLENLTCCIHVPLETAHCEAISRDLTAFPAIRTLSLQGPGAFSLLPLISSSKLMGVHVFMKQTSCTTFGDGLDILSRCHTSLRSLAVSFAVSYVDSSPDTVDLHEDVLRFPRLRPLLLLKNLTTVLLVHIFPLEIGESDVIALAQACPGILTLYLNPTPKRNPRGDGPVFECTTLSLRLLPRLAPFCQKLEFLGIFLDARQGALLPPAFDVFPVLRRLGVGISPIHDAATVSEFVGMLTPNLVSVDPSTLVDETAGFQSDWEDVSTRITERQALRPPCEQLQASDFTLSPWQALCICSGL